MRRSAIPSIPPNVDPTLHEALTAMKENIELLTGKRGGKLTPVQDSATLADVITALNKVIDRLS